ncbi:FGGY family carbohydrate kinase [Streptomyces sp. M10(2022)]
MTSLAIDAGTTTVKVVGYGPDGRELTVSHRPTRVLRPRPGWAEQDMGHVWEAVASATREVVAALPEPPELVAVTGQGDGAWLVDDRGRPTGPAVLWNDGRAADLVSRWEHDGTLEQAFRICGSRLSTGMPNAVLTWMREHDPDRTRRSRHLLTCGGWLFLKLTGEAAVDESEASAPFLDIRQRAWSERLFELYGLEWARDLLPRPGRRPPCDRAQCHRDGRDRAARGHPGGAGALRHLRHRHRLRRGQHRPGLHRARYHTVHRDRHRSRRLRAHRRTGGHHRHPGRPGHYLRAFPTMSGGDMLHWGARLLGLASVTDLMALAERGAENTAGVRFLPYVSSAGERAPFFDPGARGSLSGLSLDSGREDVARAVVEGVTMAIRDCLAASAATPELLTLSGGGARSAYWTRLIADVVGLPVAIPADTETGARGAWLTGMVATGREPDFATAAAQHVRISATCEPDPAKGRAVGDRYAEFLRLRELHRPIWALGRGGAGLTGGVGA